MKSGNLWVIFGLVVSALLVFSLWYVFFKPGRNIKRENAIQITAGAIYNAYLHDENSANKLYLDKAITVKGKISEIKTNQKGQQVIILETEDPVFGVICTMAKPLSTTKGNDVSIKGFCTGYTTDVVLRDCINENQ